MNAITLTNITKKFGNKNIFQEFSVSIKEGDMVAITGDSGSGKTTLLNIIGLIEKADEGNIEIYGTKNIKANTKKAEKLIRTTIGYLFQNFALIENETVEENLKIGLRYEVSKSEHKKRIQEALKNVGLSGYEKRKVYELSGGEQQRIAIARIMLKPSKIILADEPTGSLDSKNRDLILYLLKQMNSLGKTVLIVTHDSYVADQCNRIIHIE